VTWPPPGVRSQRSGGYKGAMADALQAVECAPEFALRHNGGYDLETLLEALRDAP
jgi:hypothetical protein